MNNIFEILYKPTVVFNRLDNLYEEDLDSNSNTLVVIFGAFLAVYSCFMEYELLTEIASGFWLVLLCLFLILISVGISIVLYSYIFTYIFYWFGKLLGSKGLVADTRTSIVYSLVPGVLSFFILLTVKYISEPFLDSTIQFWTLRIISLIFWIWTMTILVIGFRTLNKYGIVKAILNLLPLLLVGLSYYLIRIIFI
ncbi:YIP1 family protein [Carboxylicivirga sp. A043]|uniref:YIP1 family protein n=1 Tax=Carboxylicivirga litoralis TaxID=2816963 RepID=UPI0021CB31D2|nr:YIP1 family protein [Carboxylicivirga sp. A043]MCU4155386.1 YIP1 family protein [Carboxylicivirga sp. A043]